MIKRHQWANLTAMGRDLDWRERERERVQLS